MKVVEKDNHNTQKQPKDKYAPEYLIKNPYPGLDPYSEQLEEYFFGRDNEKREILQILERFTICFLIGKSGLGKSSLLNAGLVPELRRTCFAPVYVRINFDTDQAGSIQANSKSTKKKTILEQVKEIIEEKIIEIDPKAPSTEFNGRSLWKYFQEVKLFGGFLKPILIFDQFEEIFTRGKDQQNEINDLLVEMINLAENTIPVEEQRDYIERGETIPSNISKNYRIIFALREDYLPQLTGLKNYLPSLRYCVYRLQQMPGLQAFNAAFMPAQKAKPPLLDEATAWEIVNKITQSLDDEVDFKGLPEVDNKGNLKKSTGLQKDNPFGEDIENKRVEPFLLNLLCFKLNKEKKGETITIEEVKKRNLTDLVDEHYRKTIGWKFSLGMAMEDELVTPDGKFRKYSQKDSFTGRRIWSFRLGKLSEEDCDYLINQKLIRRRKLNNIDYFELIHDVLLPIVSRRRKIRALVTNVAIMAFILLIISIPSFAIFEQKLQKQQNELRLQKQQNALKLQKQQNILNLQKQQNELRLQKQQNALKLQKQQNILNLQQEQNALKFQKQQNILNLQKLQYAIELQQQHDSLKSQQRQAAYDLKFSLLEENIRRDSLISVYRADSVALASNYLPQPERKYEAIRAYDLLPADFKKQDYIRTNVFSALANNLWISGPSHPSAYNSYANNNKYSSLNNVLITPDEYYYSIPLHGIEDNKKHLVINDPQLVKAWLNQTGTMVVLERAIKKGDTTTKTITIQLSFQEQKPNFPLKINQDVVSVVFDESLQTCIFSTRFPGAIYRLPLNGFLENIYTFKGNNQYAFLVNKGKGNYCGIVNDGSRIDFDLSNLKPSVPKQLVPKKEIVSAVTYVGTAKIAMVIGCVSGNIYRVDRQGNANQFLSLTRNLTYRTRVTSLASCQVNPAHTWLAAGYFRHSLILWDLNSPDQPMYITDEDQNKKDTISHRLFIDMGSNNSISSLAFSKAENKLIVTSNQGEVYFIPLSMSALKEEVKQKSN